MAVEDVAQEALAFLGPEGANNNKTAPMPLNSSHGNGGKKNSINTIQRQGSPVLVMKDEPPRQSHATEGEKPFAEHMTGWDSHNEEEETSSHKNTHASSERNTAETPEPEYKSKRSDSTLPTLTPEEEERIISYLEGNEVFTNLNKLVANVLQERPEDPELYLLQQLGGTVPEDVPNASPERTPVTTQTVAHYLQPTFSVSNEGSASGHTTPHNPLLGKSPSSFSPALGANTRKDITNNGNSSWNKEPRRPGNPLADLLNPQKVAAERLNELRKQRELAEQQALEQRRREAQEAIRLAEEQRGRPAVRARQMAALRGVEELYRSALHNNNKNRNTHVNNNTTSSSEEEEEVQAVLGMLSEQPAYGLLQHLIYLGIRLDPASYSFTEGGTTNGSTSPSATPTTLSLATHDATGQSSQQHHVSEEDNGEEEEDSTVVADRQSYEEHIFRMDYASPLAEPSERAAVVPVMEHQPRLLAPLRVPWVCFSAVHRVITGRVSHKKKKKKDELDIEEEDSDVKNKDSDGPHLRPALQYRTMLRLCHAWLSVLSYPYAQWRSLLRATVYNLIGYAGCYITREMVHKLGSALALELAEEFIDLYGGQDRVLAQMLSLSFRICFDVVRRETRRLCDDVAPHTVTATLMLHLTGDGRRNSGGAAVVQRPQQTVMTLAELIGLYTEQNTSLVSRRTLNDVTDQALREQVMNSSSCILHNIRARTILPVLRNIEHASYFELSEQLLTQGCMDEEELAMLMAALLRCLRNTDNTNSDKEEKKGADGASSERTECRLRQPGVVAEEAMHGRGTLLQELSIRSRLVLAFVEAIHACHLLSIERIMKDGLFSAQLTCTVLVNVLRKVTTVAANRAKSALQDGLQRRFAHLDSHAANGVALVLCGIMEGRISLNEAFFLLSLCGIFIGQYAELCQCVCFCLQETESRSLVTLFAYWSMALRQHYLTVMPCVLNLSHTIGNNMNTVVSNTVQDSALDRQLRQHLQHVTRVLTDTALFASVAHNPITRAALVNTQSVFFQLQAWDYLQLAESTTKPRCWYTNTVRAINQFSFHGITQREAMRMCAIPLQVVRQLHDALTRRLTNNSNSNGATITNGVKESHGRSRGGKGTTTNTNTSTMDLRWRLACCANIYSTLLLQHATAECPDFVATGVAACWTALSPHERTEILRQATVTDIPFTSSAVDEARVRLQPMMTRFFTTPMTLRSVSDTSMTLIRCAVMACRTNDFLRRLQRSVDARLRHIAAKTCNVTTTNSSTNNTSARMGSGAHVGHTSGIHNNTNGSHTVTREESTLVMGSMGALTGSVSRAPLLRVYGQRTLLYTMTHTATKMRCFAKLHEHILDDWEAFLRDPGTAYDCSKAVFDVIPAEYTSINDVYLFLEDVRSYPQKYMRVFAASVTRQEVDTVAVFLALHRRVTMSAVEVLVLTIFNLFIQQHPEYLRAGEEYELLKLIDHIQRTSIDLRCLMQMHLRHLTPMQRFLQAHLADGEVKRHLALHATRYGAVSISDRLLLAGPRMTHSLGAYAIISEPMSTMSLWCTNTLYVEVVRSVSTGSAFAESWFTRQAVELLQSLGLTLAMLRSGTAMPSCRALLTNALLKGCPVAFVRRTLAAYFDTLRGLHVPFDPRLQDLFNAVLHGHMDQSLDDSEVGARMMGRLLHGKHNNNTALSPMRNTTTMNSNNGKADNASQAAALIAHVMELDEEEERSAARRFAMYCTRHGLHLPTRAFVYRIMYEGPTMERTATGGIYVHSVSSLTQHGGASSSVATNPYSRNSPSSRQGNDNNEEDGEDREEGDVTTSAKGGDEVALVGQDLFYEIYHTLCLLSRLLLLPRTSLTSHGSSSSVKQEQLCRGQIASLLQCDPIAQAGLRQLLLLGLGTSATGMDVLTCFGRYMTRQLPQLFERGQKYRRERVVKATGLWMRCMTELGDCVQSLMQNLYTPRQLPAANVITALPERFVTLNVAPALDCVACVEADLMPGGTSALQYTSGSAVEYYNPLCEVLYEHLRYNQHGDMRMTCRHLISLLEGGPGDLVTAVIVLLCSLREYERPDNKSTTTNSPGKTSGSSMPQKKNGRNGIDANQRMGRGGSDAGAMRELEGYMEDNEDEDEALKAEEEKDSNEIDSPVPVMKEVEESEESKPSERRQRGKHSWAQDCIRFLFSDLFQSVLYYTQVLLLQYEEQVQKSVDWALRHYKLSTTALLSAARLLVDAVPMVEPGLPLSAELLKPTQQHQISTALVNTLLAAMSIIENTAGELPHQIRDDAEMHAAQDLSRQSAPKPRQSNAVRFLRLQHYRSLLVPADLLELLLTFGIMPREVMILADLFTNAVMRRATARREGTNSSNTGGGSSGVMSTTSSMSHFSTAPRKPPISSSSVTTTVVPASNNIGGNNNNSTVNEGYERSVTSDHNSSNGTSNSGHRLADSMLALWRHYICLVNDSLRQCLRVAHCRLLQRSLRQKVTLLMHNAVSSEQLGQLLHIGLVRQARQHHNRALSRDAMSLGHPSQAAVFEDELSAEMRESRPFVEAWQMPGLLLACDLDSEENGSHRANDCGTGEACEEKTHAADPNATGLDESTALFVSLTNLAVGATEVVNNTSSTATVLARNETGMEGATQRTMRSLHKCASTTVGPGPQKGKFLHTTTQAHSPVARFNTLAGAQRMTQIYDTNSLVNSPAGSNDRHGQLDVMASPPQMSWHSSSSHVRLAETLPASVCRSIFFDALHNENGAFLQSLLHTARTAIGHTSDIKSTTGSETTSSSSASFDFAQALLWSFYKQLSSGATVPLARTLCFTFSELKELTYVWQTYAHLMSTNTNNNGASPTLSFPIYPVQNAENNTSNRSSPTNSPILNHLNVLSPTTATTSATLVDEIAELFAGSRPGRQQKMYEAVRQLDDVMRNRFARLADWPTFSRVLCAYVADLTLYEQRLLHVLLQRYWAPLVHRICRRLAASGASEPQLLLVVRALRSMRVALAVLRRMQCRMQVSLLLRTLPHGAITAFTQQFSASAMVMTGPHRGSMSFLRVPHGGTTSNNNNANTTNAVVRLVSHAPNSSAGTNTHGRNNKDKDTHNSGADDASLNTDQQILQAIEDIMYDFEHTVLEDDKAPREMHSELHVFTSWLEKCRPQTGIYALVEVLREVDKIPPPPLLDGADMHAPRGGVGNALAQDHLYLFLACSFLFHRLTSELFYDAPRLPPFSTMPVFMTNEVRIGLTLQSPQTQHNTFTNNHSSAVAVVGGHDATHNSIIATGAAHRSSLQQQQQQQQQQRRHNNNGLGVSILSTSSVAPTFMTGQEWGQRRGNSNNNNNNMNRNGSDFAPLDALQQTGITTNARRRREPFVATLTLSHVMVQQCITNTLELLLREKSEAAQGTKSDKGPDSTNATAEGGEEAGLHSLTPCPAEHVDKIDLKSTLRELLESIVAFITAGMEDSSDLVPLFYKIQPRLMRGVRQLFWYSYADFCFICYTLQSSMQRLVYVRANPQLNIIIDRLNGTLCRTMYTHYHSATTHMAASQNGRGTMRGLLQASHSISSPLNMHGYAPSVASVSPQNSRSRLSTATTATHNANHGDYWSMSKASSAVMSACSSVTRAPTAHSHPSRWATSTMTEHNGQASASVVAMQRYIEHCQSKEFPFTTLKGFTFIWLQLLSELTDLYLQALPNFRQHFAQHTQHRAHDDYLRYFIILLHQIAFVCGTVPWPTFNLIHTLIQDWIKFVQERLQVLGLRQMQQTAQQAATATAAVVDAGFMGAEMEGCDMIDIPTTTAAAAKSALTENDPYMCKSVSVANIATSAMHALTLVIAAQSHNTLTVSVPPWRSDLHLAIATLMTGSVEAGLALPHVQRIGYPTQEQIALAPIEAAVWERALGYILFLVRGLAPHEESRKHGTGGNAASNNTNSNNIHASSSSPHSPTTMEEAESSKSCMNATSTMTPYTQRPLMREDSADSTTKTNSTIPPTGLNAAREQDERAHTFSAASTNITSAAANRSSQRPSQQAKEEKHHGSSAKPRGTSHERVITLAEVKEANTPKKTWTVINDVVYDITRYVYIHPGGIRWMLQNCAGRDATAAFLQQHGGDQVVLQQLEHFRIGVLDVQAQQRHSMYSI